MKRHYRESALNALFARLQSEDFDRREHALFELALMLRRANSDGSASGRFEFDNDSLPRDLQRIRLGMDDQHRVVERLLLLIAGRRESRATAFWALSEVAAAAGWEPTLALLNVCGEELGDEAAYQACRALRRWLDSAAPSTASVNLEFDISDLFALADGWAASADDRLAREASAVLELLKAKFK